MYADDTCLSFSSNSISTIIEKVNEDLECLKTWLAGNKLSLNVAKTNSIVIGSRKRVNDIKGVRYDTPCKKNFPQSILQTMYRSMVEPYFHFYCPVCGVCATTGLNKSQKLQNSAARIVTNSPYRMFAPPIIRQLGWQTVKELIETETVKMVYRSINQEAPE